VTRIELHYAPAPAVSTGSVLLTWTFEGKTYGGPVGPGQTRLIDAIGGMCPHCVPPPTWDRAVRCAIKLGASGHTGSIPVEGDAVTAIELRYGPSGAYGDAFLAWDDKEQWGARMRPNEITERMDEIRSWCPAGADPDEWARAVSSATHIGASGYSGSVIVWCTR
jgi:hypothetical protein